MPTSNVIPAGLSTCCVFKSRLQEYAQKVGILSPVYETTKEGPSHEPFFRSTVIVNNVRYDSLPGFYNRKAAEQSAAEVALVELAKDGEVDECVSQPLHETGLCKNLLQEYAQKMNYAIPKYENQKQERAGKKARFSCTVDIGGIKYIGAAAKTKKEAEIKAARTAVLAIQTSTTESGEKPTARSQLTVLPPKRKGTDSSAVYPKTEKALKPKKRRFKPKLRKKNDRPFGKRGGSSEGGSGGALEVGADAQSLSESVQVADLGVFAADAKGNFGETEPNPEEKREERAMAEDLGHFSAEVKREKLEEMALDFEASREERAMEEGASVSLVDMILQNEQKPFISAEVSQVDMFLQNEEKPFISEEVSQVDMFLKNEQNPFIPEEVPQGSFDGSASSLFPVEAAACSPVSCPDFCLLGGGGSE